MTQWEYKVETRNQKGLDEVKFLTEMGTEGWELVSVIFKITSVAGYDYYNYYFKRNIIEK